jgi:hypothetical protein
MLAPIFEDEARSGDEHGYRSGNPQLARRGCIEHASSDVDGDAGDVTPSSLDFAGVEACTDLYAEGTERITERRRAPDGPSGPVEGRKNSVTGGLEQVAGVLFDHRAGHDIVTVKQVAPSLVTNRRKVLGRSHEVGEEDRSQRTVSVAWLD